MELLTESGDLIGEPRPITHPVKFFEKGDRPLEIVTSRQWFVATRPMRDKLLQAAEDLNWHPGFMSHRLRTWVEGLNADWNISRQRFFGVPFPVWYPIGADGLVDFASPLTPHDDQLPIDPSTDVPAGYDESQRGVPGGFLGDPDVMDTWATSSLTPQIAGRWEDDPDLFARIFPMDVRPQAHEIIRTWLFTSVVRSELEFGVLPWANATISGWVLDPDRKKMSKSKGNVVTPMPLLETHGADAVRYWAASGRPGTDTAVDDAQMKVGRRLAIKILNASRFALGRLGENSVPPISEVTAPLDVDLIASLRDLVAEVTQAFEDFDYARALERTETFFWRYCDDYVELVKIRAYGNGTDPDTVSAQAALAHSLSALLRLFAPFLPFVAEEVWQWWQEGSIHNAAWPTVEELAVDAPRTEGVFDATSDVLSAIRREKTASKRSMRTPVDLVVVTNTPSFLAQLSPGLGDLKDAGGAAQIDLHEGEPSVEVTLAPEEPKAS